MSNTERTCQTGIVYGETGGVQLLLDLYLPERETNAEPMPVVLYIHGGGWVEGSRSGPSGVAFALEMSAEGIAVASIDYRLAPEHIAPAAILDCKLAARWLKANAATYGIDPEKIIAMGNSAGGHLAAMLALTRPSDGFDGEGLGEFSSDVAAAVDLCGIADVAELIQGDNPAEWAQVWVPGAGADRIDLARRCSPLSYVRSDTPPMLIVHGDTDPYVPHHQSLRLQRALKKAGADVELVSIPGAGHFLGITGPVTVQHAVRDAWRKFFARLGVLAEGAAV